MRVVITILNIICVLWAVISIFTGIFAGVLMAAAYGMSLGSMYGSQKKGFHIIAIVLNAIYILIGLVVVVAGIMGKLFVETQSLLIFMVAIISLLLVFLPAMNIFYAKTKMVQLS